MNARFLIARYVPDLPRGETRNIGVVAWIPGRVLTSFIDPDTVDFIADPDVFKRWINYWNRLASQEKIQIRRMRPISNRSSRFLSAIQMTQDGNYLLDEVGEIIDSVSDSNLDEATEFLFERLVAPSMTVSGEKEPSLSEKCESILEKSEVFTGPLLARRYAVTLEFTGFRHEIHFDYAVVDESLRYLISRVNLRREESVVGATAKFSETIQRKIITKDRCVSLFDSEATSNISANAVRYLSESSTAIVIADEDEAVSKLRELAKAA
jgi:hypothetical protein